MTRRALTKLKGFCVVLRTVLRGSAPSLRGREGQVVLPMLLVFVFLVALLGIAIGTAAVLQTVQSGQQVFSEQAYGAADSGVREAMLRLARNRDHDTQLLIPAYFELPLPGSCSSVSISGFDANSQKTIIAEGHARANTRRLEVTVHVPENGNVIVREWKEITAASSIGTCTPGAPLAGGGQVFANTSHPLQQLLGSVAFTSGNTNDYNMGYSFTPLQDGQITRIGGRWGTGSPLTKKVRFYLQSTGENITPAPGYVEVTSSGPADWGYADVSPAILITGGTNYVVAVRAKMNGTNDWRYNDLQPLALTLPQTIGGVTINDSRYFIACDAMPGASAPLPCGFPAVQTLYMFGQADIEFQY